MSQAIAPSNLKMRIIPRQNLEKSMFDGISYYWDSLFGNKEKSTKIHYSPEKSLNSSSSCPDLIKDEENFILLPKEL